MSSEDAASNKPCPVCATGTMRVLNRIEHGDRSLTIYWRCPGCSHIQVVQTPQPLDQSAKPN